jgi:hypothetical protein
MESNSNLYQDINGCRAFGGVVKAEDKGLMMIFDQWNHDEVKNDIPVGINLNLMRAMEAFLDKPTIHVKAKRVKPLKTKTS